MRFSSLYFYKFDVVFNYVIGAFLYTGASWWKIIIFGKDIKLFRYSKIELLYIDFYKYNSIVQ